MLLREEEYSHATAILSGMEEKTSLFTELEQWFEETYGLRVYDYFCGLTNAGRPRLRLLLWDRDCVGKMKKGANPDERKQRRTAEKFAANVKHFFILLGKMFFTPYGKEFFAYPGKQIFTS